MSTFEGLELEKEEPRISYAPGSGLEEELATEFLDLYLRDSSPIQRAINDNDFAYPLYLKEDFQKCVSILTDRLESQDYHPQVLLDSLVGSISMRALPYHMKYINCLLDPLVQALYNLGHNEFSLDLTSFPQEPWLIACMLQGTPDKPLQASYRGALTAYTWISIRKFSAGAAMGVQNCRLTFHDEVSRVGYESSDSEIICHESVKIWRNNKRCTFHAPSYGSFGEGTSECSLYIHWPSQVPLRSRIARRAALGTRMFGKRLSGFRKRGNRLYIPEGEDSWKEVLL